MDKMLYIGMSGAKQTELAQAVNNNNLANANTTGFREDLAAFKRIAVEGPVYPSREYSELEGKGHNFQSGAIMSTGRDLDVALQGEGWIAIQAPDGGEAYSRRGDLHVSANGLLLDGVGRSVMGDDGPIAVPPYEKLEIGNDGTISIVPLGQPENNLIAVDRIRLVNPDDAQMKKGEDGLVRFEGNGLPDADANIKLLSGALESSNVNTVESMVKMIELSRHFETQVKVMRTAEEKSAAATRLLRMTS